MPIQEFYMIRKLVRGTGISYHLLKIKANKFMLFLNRREALKRYILSEKVQKFLRGYGYPADDFSAMLHRLFSRVEQYSRGEIAYPHEMGACAAGDSGGQDNPGDRSLSCDSQNAKYITKRKG